MTRRALWIGGGILLAIYLIWGLSRDDFHAFNRQREDWHRRCDAYMGDRATMNDPVRRKDCEREAAELLAYAKRKGWAR